MKLRHLAHIVFLAASLPALLPGQAMDGNLVGSVRDASAGSLVGVSVELENAATGVKYATRTNESGAYRFHNVAAGVYRLEASHAGFATVKLQNVAVDANKQSTVNLKLEVGAVATAVEVRDMAAVIDTTTANVSSSYGGRQALQLPVTGSGAGPSNHGVLNLSLLSAGVGSSGGIGYGTGPSVGGQRPTNNNFMIEAVDNNNKTVTGPQVAVSNEAVAEFTLQQNQFSLEFGNSSGGQFNTILKSGGNDLHGSFYEYFQNRHLNAVDESLRRQRISDNARFDANRFGSTIGGPILKNRWFYFGNFEYNPVGQQSTSSGTAFVPTADGYRVLDGISGLSKRNLDTFKEWVPASPAASRTMRVAGRDVPVGILRTIGPAFQNNYNALFSSDYNLSQKDQVRARYLYSRSAQIENGVQLPTFFSPVRYSAHLANLSEFHTFTPSLTNELRLAYSRRVEDRPAGTQQFPGLDAFPNLQFDDLSLNVGPFGQYPQSSRNNTFQLVDNVNWIKGRHTLKFGYDGRQLNNSNFFVQNARGAYMYSTFESYLLDLTPAQGQRSVGATPFIGNLIAHSAFVSDEIRLRSNLSATIGVRYEFVDVPYGAKLQGLNSLSSVPGLEFRAPRPDKKDFAPRIGLAWSPGRDGRTSVRAGFGLAYDQIYQNLSLNSLPPQYFTTVDAQISYPNSTAFLANGGIPGTAVPITSAATARRLTSTFIPDQQRPYSVQWNFGVQRVLRDDYTLEVRYLASRGVHLPMQLQLNRQADVTGPSRSLPTYLQRPAQSELDSLSLKLTDFSLNFAQRSPLAAAGLATTLTSYRPQGNSTYHGLATQLSKRFSKSLQFVGAYTWSHNIDDSTATFSSTVLTPRRAQDFFNLGPERASSALDRRHRLTMSWVYDSRWFNHSSNRFAKQIVGNWTFTGIYTAETGAWGTLRSGVDSNFNGDNATDRTIVNPAGDASRGSTVTALRNSAGAVVGYLANDPTARYINAGQGAFPNAGRNTLRLPGINNFDLTLGKRVRIRETAHVEFRAEFYNALNHAQFTPGFTNTINPRPRPAPPESGMLVPGNALFQRPDMVFQSNSRTAQLVLRAQF